MFLKSFTSLLNYLNDITFTNLLWLFNLNPCICYTHNFAKEFQNHSPSATAECKHTLERLFQISFNIHQFLYFYICFGSILLCTYICYHIINNSQWLGSRCNLCELFTNLTQSQFFSIKLYNCHVATIWLHSACSNTSSLLAALFSPVSSVAPPNRPPRPHHSGF